MNTRMNFHQCHMDRLESITTSTNSKDMNTLLHYLKQTGKELRFLCYTEKGSPLIRNKEGIYSEEEMNECQMNLMCYMGTTEQYHYIAVTTKIQPQNSIEMHLRTCMIELEKELCDMLGYGSCLIKFNISATYCFRCGTKMTYGDYGHCMNCPNCKNQVFPRTDPVIIVLIKHPTEKKCLFVRKPIMPVNRYTCIAGFLEVGESGESCVIREAFEEAHLRVKNVKYVISSAYPMAMTNQLMLGYEAESIDTEIDIVPGNELCEAFWATEDEVKYALEQSNKYEFSGKYTVPECYIAHQLFKHWISTLN